MDVYSEWGQDAIGVISERLQKEMPGRRGFSERNLKKVRMFYEEWEILSVATDEFRKLTLNTSATANEIVKLDKSNSADASAEIIIKYYNFKKRVIFRVFIDIIFKY